MSDSAAQVSVSFGSSSMALANSASASAKLRWMGGVHSGGPTEPNRSAALELACKAVAIDRNDAET